MSRCHNDEKVADVVLEFILAIMSKANPSSLLYVAFDGVPPFAKLKEQAKRRKSAGTNTGLYSNMISPGTEFIEKLTDKLEKLLRNVAKRKMIKVLISTSSVPGEGEHKIFQHIKTHPSRKCVIYGLDADLILLGIMSNNAKNLIILREVSRTRYESIAKKKFEYLDVNTLRNRLVAGYSCRYEHYFVDIVLIFIILGNDFLPRPEGSDIHHNLHELLGALKDFHEISEGNYLVSSTGDLNVDSFNLFIDSVYDMGLARFLSEYPVTDKVADIELVEQMKTLSLGYPESRTDRGLRKKYDEWRFDNYKKWRQKDKTEIKAVARDYMQGLQWTVKYYLNGTWTNHWVFQHDHVPCLPDLKLEQREEIKKIDEVAIELKPIHHLALVSPLQSRRLLPQVYQNFQLTPIEDLDSFDKIKQEIHKMRTELDPHMTAGELKRNELLEEALLLS